MSGIGFDCGTYNLICCKRNAEGNFANKREVNAFLKIPLDNKFVFNMMKKANVPLIERKDANAAYALGEAAVNMAYSMNGIDLRRPMNAGCLNPQEKSAQQIMSIMIHSLLDNIENDGEILYYSVPANAINEETDADYHSKVLESIFKAFKDKDGKQVAAYPINEGLALIYAELGDKAYTGMGVSCGAGMVNVCFAIYGNPIFQFAIVNSGDWIDKMAAKATGETPTYINQEKLKTDLTNKNPESLVQRVINAQYEIMISKTIAGIKEGLEDKGNKVRQDHPIDIVIAGGTSMPKGFDTLFAEMLKKANMPIDIGKVIRPKDPLFSVGRGCLIAAEAHSES